MITHAEPGPAEDAVPFEPAIVSDDLPEEPPTDRPRASGWHPDRRPVEDREVELHHSRKFLAYGSIIALWTTLGIVAVRWAAWPDTDLQPIAQTVLLPLVAFVGPIVGFYFRDPHH